MRKPKCECCEQGIEEMQARQKEIFDRLGYYVHYVFDASDDPDIINAHTHGLEQSYGHPDLQIVVALPYDVASAVFEDAVQQIREGVVFVPGGEYDKVIGEFKVTFIPATENKRPLLRMILPDKHGNLTPSAPGVFGKQWTIGDLGVVSKPVLSS